MALALALQRQGNSVRIFEARQRGNVRNDARILALSHGSRQILESLGVWGQIAATPIAAIHVSQRGSLGRTRFAASEEGLPALGYVVAAANLGAALDSALLAAGVPYLEQARVDRADCSDAGVHLHTSGGEAEARLVVYAEGSAGVSADADAEAIVRDYRQSAVICSVDVAAPHGNIAWERFTDHGPVALLPLGSKMALVYSCASERALALAQLGEAEFLTDVQRLFGTRLKFSGASQRRVFPLTLRLRRAPVAERAVWLGNAAQTLHPVAGQGFNLALRDVAQLARTLVAASDPGAAELLRGYARARRLDRIATIGCTDALARLFTIDLPLASAARGGALLALDLLPPLRHFVARRMIFGARAF